MTLRLYMDVHIHAAITKALRNAGVDVLTSQEDHTERLDDPALLDRATLLNRILFSNDADLLAEACKRQQEAGHFAGLFYAYPLNITVAKCIEDLELAAKVYEEPDMADRVEFLPLR
jgi:hypothetical protein